MCTVTIIPHGNGIRMACNRDESRKRPAALPPRVVTVGQRQALMPIDPQSGGTWIAVNDAGLILTLLNAYSSPRDPDMPTPRISRGTIIPRLLEAETLAEAFDRTRELHADDYGAFRLVMADKSSFAEIHANAGLLVRTPPSRIDGPLLFTSSGLGDDLVGPPRRALFEEFFVAGKDWIAQQDAYHRHSWADRRHLSVCMQRPEARTVSLTIVELDKGDVKMVYYRNDPILSIASPMRPPLPLGEGPGVRASALRSQNTPPSPPTPLPRGEGSNFI